MKINFLIPLALAMAAAAMVVAVLLLPSPEPTARTPVEPMKTDAAPAPDVPAAVLEGTPAVQDSPTTASTKQEVTTLNEDEWVAKLDELLTSDEDNSVTTRRLIAAMPGLSAEGQEEFVAHALNLCEDEDFGLLENFYLGTNTPPAVIEAIFNDALNRPDEVKLPLLAKTLRNPSHPMAGEAREILEMYLDLEPGAVPGSGWDTAVQQYLREEAEMQ